MLEVTSACQGITSQIRTAFVMFIACHGDTQEAPVTGLIDDEQGADRVTRLLATVVFLLVLWTGWAIDQARRAIMPIKSTWCFRFFRLSTDMTSSSIQPFSANSKLLARHTGVRISRGRPTSISWF